MSKILKIADRQTAEINKQILESWGQDNLDNNFRPVLLISVNDRDQISFKAIDGISTEALAGILEVTTKQIKSKIK